MYNGLKMNNIALFTYDFEHKKSLDFFNIVLDNSNFSLVVIAAPWVNLNGSTPTEKHFGNSEIKEVCDTKNIPYISCSHNDHARIKSVVNKYNLDIGIVAGARIIPKKTIELFRDGILNFHPGKIPETSGLDSFYYTLKNNCSYGVTSHFIDYKVDAGELVEFEEVTIELNDSIESLKEKNYALQLKMLNKFLTNYKNNDIECKKIIRPFKNNALSKSEKISILNNFQIWKNFHWLSQYNAKIFEACVKGDLEFLQELDYPGYIANLINEKGRSTLLVSAFNQRYDVCKWLIEHGADINYQNSKGTSILMFAKTHANNIELIRLLLDNGANPYLTDCFGKDIFYYLNKNNQLNIIEYLKEFTK